MIERVDEVGADLGASAGRGALCPGCGGATPNPHGPGLLGRGTREGKAMIATLRHRLICIPARLIRHAAALILRLPPGHQLLTEILTRLTHPPRNP